MRIQCAAVVAGLLLLGTSTAARAQDTTRFWSFGADHESGVYIGMSSSPRFRLEWELALRRQHDEIHFDQDNGFGGRTVVDEEVTSSLYGVGVGFLWQWQRADRVRLYAGPRIGFTFVNAKDRLTGDVDGSGTSKRTDAWIAGSLGVEYFVVPHVSAGADVQLRGVFQGDADQSTTGAGGAGAFAPSDPTLATRGLLVLRFYP